MKTIWKLSIPGFLPIYLHDSLRKSFRNWKDFHGFLLKVLRRPSKDCYGFFFLNFLRHFRSSKFPLKNLPLVFLKIPLFSWMRTKFFSGSHPRNPSKMLSVNHEENQIAIKKYFKLFLPQTPAEIFPGSFRNSPGYSCKNSLSPKKFVLGSLLLHELGPKICQSFVQKLFW